MAEGNEMNQGAVWVCDLFKSCTMLIQKMSKHVCCNLWWFALNAFQNDMTWPGSTKNQGGDRFQGIDLDAGQGLPCKDWVGVLPTQTFLNSNLVTPENFIQFHPSIQHYSWSSLTQTDWRTDGHTNSIQNESPHYPMQVRVEFFYAPFFLPLSKWSEQAEQAHSVLFW